ncbi:Hypothetical protein A7982_00848 [Minicystis rosea]|nr:Hypothetical protein A7982_00848 [Minicystis rosea]
MRRASTTFLLLAGTFIAAGCRNAPTAAPSVTSSTTPTSTATAIASATSAPPALPPPPSPEAVHRGDQLAGRAESCFADPRCSMSEATRLYLEADDAGASNVSCFRIYYGAGVPADPARARACFERVVAAERDFAGSSPSLPRIFLGLMLLDAQGGPRDRARGEKLFADCHLGNDSGVGVAAREREKSGAQKPIDFCEDIGGTTLDTNACAEVSRDRAVVAAYRATKEIVARLALDDEGLALWKKADTAWDRFTFDDARYAGDAYRDGSMRVAQETWISGARAGERIEVIRALLDDTAARKDAAREVKQAEAKARAASRDAQNKELLVAAQKAWVAYRAAELAFVRRALAKPHGGEAPAARALEAELDTRRAKALQESVKAIKGIE